MSAWSSAPASPGSPASATSSVLTPRRKVQALLAQFGSDSDSDNPIEKRREQQDDAVSTLQTQHVASNPQAIAESEDSDEEEEQIMRPSRLTARLMGGAKESVTTEPKLVDHPSLRIQDSSVNTMRPIEATSDEINDRVSSGEDEINMAPPKRRLFVGTTGDGPTKQDRPRSASPLFFSSPASSRHSNAASPVSQNDQQTASSPAKPADGGRTKFLALVEKHRRERLAKEAADIARKAMSSKAKKSNGRQRGSSPADDSDEGASSGSEGATRRIAKQARPARKASKKALEEMNRETQRMSRNMQLAHQAKTKKKITKESLFARFNFLPAAEASTDDPVRHKSVNDSSVSSSEQEDVNGHSTPPTSPLRAPEPKQVTENAPEQLGEEEMHGGLFIQTALPNCEDAVTERGRELLLQYDRINRTVFSPEPEKADFQSTSEHPVSHTMQAVQVQTTQFKFTRQFNPSAEADSDSEIEIVTARGLKRKFAVFESVPTRKVKEKPSHIALRSLARLNGGSDKKQAMNAAEMEASLRQTARLQAIQERQQKIQELRAKGIVIQSAEEREQDQQEVEDLVERARQEAADIQKREKELAKKDGTYVNDGLDDEEDSDDEDFEEDNEDLDDDDEEGSGSEGEEAENVHDGNLVMAEAEDASSEESATEEVQDEDAHAAAETPGPKLSSMRRKARIVSDDEDEDEDVAGATAIHENTSPELPTLLTRTPQSVLRSTKKVIPGLQMSDDLPMGLSQAFAATMADSQSQDVDGAHDVGDLIPTVAFPSPQFARAQSLQRVDSLDMISDSQPATQIPASVDQDGPSQSERIPESPARGLGMAINQQTPSHIGFDLTQDGGYMLSPFRGSRFAETPKHAALDSSVPTVILQQENGEDSPAPQRRGRLRRGQVVPEEDADDVAANSAFQVMEKAARRKGKESEFEKSKSNARAHFDEAAEESEDEYAGLGGASDDEGDDVENEEDRQMIDEDTQVGQGDEAKLAGLYADRERERDEKAVSKLLKDITTGALRRKRGVGDDLDLSDEEDQVARRREAKRREFARMRRELLKDEAVGKIADDKRKEAFLRSIEDREDAEEELEIAAESQGDLQEASQQQPAEQQRPLSEMPDTQLNRLGATSRRSHADGARKPATLAEIRESVSFLIDEPDSQAATIDLGLSDSEDEAEAYVDLDRHFRDAEANENDLDDDGGDLGDFVVDDEDDSHSSLFKKPDVPRKERAPFAERRRPRADVIDRLSLLRQSSSSASTGSNGNGKMAFFSSKSLPGLGSMPSLLRRATTNSSLGSMVGREGVSATGVTTNKTERGNASDEKEFIRRGSSGRRSAVNYQARTTLKEEKMSERAGIQKSGKNKQKGGKGGHGFLGGLFRGDSWE